MGDLSSERLIGDLSFERLMADLESLLTLLKFSLLSSSDAYLLSLLLPSSL